jgi:hypothetical protein
MGRRFFRANKDSVDMIRWYNTHRNCAYGEPPRRLTPPFERNKLHTGCLYPTHPIFSLRRFDEFT